MFGFKQIFMDSKVELKETEAGYALEFKGDKEELKKQLEALLAFVEFKKKASAAGMQGPHNHFKAMHERFVEMHKKHHYCK
ncbi:hypothetical protein MFMK1_002441 [Metallumcola ferriviriculae]|uniref:Uncharacterized protein n=1 Tax=Metallumcola ferriviriculae TaxID=3039180 RepID=A0AAU0UQU9_9FIRM|nr:hypothetical protein MFMK1_002441 [Desulfitibacteraceae bacterium MK1]